MLYSIAMEARANSAKKYLSRCNTKRAKERERWRDGYKDFQISYIFQFKKANQET